MDNSNTNSRSSTPEAMKDENQKPAPKAKRSIMREHFQAWHAIGRPSLFPPSYDVYTPQPFFFYGTLAEPSKLQEILQLPSPPVFKPARVGNYKIMLWGQYPALVDDRSPDIYVDGMTCVIETEQHLQMLEKYETKAYRVDGIQIEIDGQRILGRTFLWATSDTCELTEGTWSLEEWKWKRDVEKEMASHF
jgi:gamma-glutamylcyclotransferase (GGCT)/AIG2-like uncharacterized protein YtfP